MPKNIFLDNSPKRMDYSPRQLTQSEKETPKRSRRNHALKLEKELKKAIKDQQDYIDRFEVQKAGHYIEVTGEPNFSLETNSLENKNIGTKLLNIKIDEDNVERATIFLPLDKDENFLKKITEYKNENLKSGKPKNEKLIISISNINRAFLDAFWTSNIKFLPEEHKEWCEIWLLKTEYSAENIKYICFKNEIEVKESTLSFPERQVFLAHVNREDLEKIVNSSSYLAEIRKATPEISFFMDLRNIEQVKWAQDFKDRIIKHETGVYISLLDTGVNNGHLLLSDLLSDEDLHSVFDNYGVEDLNGHGTAMAGILAYNNIYELLEGRADIDIKHDLESVKVLPDKGENKPDLYGAIINRAISELIIENPDRTRIYCMAISSGEKEEETDGSPSSWSAALDQIISGEVDEIKKLLLLATGNITAYPSDQYPDYNILQQIEEPGQSWNALTVGAYTELDRLEGYEVLAKKGEISPYSKTSRLWNKGWPIKPEVVNEGGNLVDTGDNALDDIDLSLITTDHNVIDSTFTVFKATSLSTASTSWMAAEIQSEYPEAWPETIRALIVHSAAWTDEMKKQFMNTEINKREYYKLLRTVGYGVPNLDSAIKTLKNRVNMVIESTIQPFELKDNRVVSNEMHLHELPWPKEDLEDLGDVEVTLKITLSYFIEPAPGTVGWKDKYRYQSHGLRFDINGNSDEEDLLKRINNKARSDDDKGIKYESGAKWCLGTQNRDVGSIHSDWWTGSASDLALNNYVAVYPVAGWWKDRKHLGKYDSDTRYSIVVSLSTQEQEIDLYTSIVNKIETSTTITASI